MSISLTQQEFSKLEALPESASALFGAAGIHATKAWYESTADAALPPGASATFLIYTVNNATVAIFPLQKGPGRNLQSMTTPYTGLWHPLLAPDLPDSTHQSIAAAFAAYCRHFPITRLDALDAQSPFWPYLRAACRTARLAAFSFHHFGNWHETLRPGTTWQTFLAARPGALREAIRRKTARLFKSRGARLEIHCTPENLNAAIDAYEEIYAASWKQPEPFPRFVPAFIRAAAQDGTLRLAILHAGNRPIAAQLWTVHTATATLMKLAHREDMDAFSPGTVLTAATIRHLLENENITALDFGRGDDPFKSLWTSHRAQRTGLLLANPASLRGAASILRHGAGEMRRKAVFFEKKKQKTFNP